ncbi:bestrophin-like domain [Chlorobium ferrooxidans]|uniref:DUF4239 domain-containing protein n=1 Tax=Chlorobium ferrooxidans DSM 13031 TaxID=377431 RepID=Q0YRQ5_9CHLB|nr:DUF4239 domain-containing protein [Chlorobium ferrooxidans]EAT58958.1 conserved hypothetical protein [Chlorobium ferrooxidans DSM 13031]
MFTLIICLLFAGLFAGMLFSVELGRRIGLGTIRRNPDGLAKGIGPVEGAVFGLLGLIIAFTFAGAESRFENRRHLITEEANAIGTAYLRIKLLPPDTQPEVRELFRRYLDTRVSAYRNVEDEATTKANLEKSTALQEEIWQKSITACERPDLPKHSGILVFTALNNMIDITNTRATATIDHPPFVILLLFFALSFISSLLVGYNMSVNNRRHWFHPVAFAAIVSLTVFVILDIEFPRRGLVRVDRADKPLLELRQSMLNSQQSNKTAP